MPSSFIVVFYAGLKSLEQRKRHLGIEISGKDEDTKSEWKWKDGNEKERERSSTRKCLRKGKKKKKKKKIARRFLFPAHRFHCCIKISFHTIVHSVPSPFLYNNICIFFCFSIFCDIFFLSVKILICYSILLRPISYTFWNFNFYYYFLSQKNFKILSLLRTTLWVWTKK